MRGAGVTYDTGFINRGTSTHEPFDPRLVRREMQIIHDDLHCNAVRVTGGHVERLEIAADLPVGGALPRFLARGRASAFSVLYSGG